MKISYLGTAAAEGVPAMFCSCQFCQSVRKAGEKAFRTRSQVIIDDELSVDFPPEAYVHSLRYNVDLSSLRYLLVTHSHMDHFYAHDFVLRGYKYATVKEEKLHIYGNEEVKAVFDECTRREIKKEVAKHIEFNVVHSYGWFKAGNYNVLTVPARHGTAEEALLYYIERGGKGYLHLCDTGGLCDDAVSFLAEYGAHAQIVTFDCTFLDATPKAGTRHMCIADDMDIKRRLLRAGVIDEDATCVITHFSHNSNPTAERISAVEKKYGVIAAYDGLTLEI